MQTKLIYMEHMSQYNCEAKVVDIKEDEGVTSVILDQTVFYPQGGGQPYDTGIISNDNSIFQVTEVRYENNNVHHIGKFEIGRFGIGEIINCEIDIEKRKQHTRLHSIGHLIDIAVKELGLNWKPTKGYHFPQGAYIEYIGGMQGKSNIELIKEIEDKSNEIISRNTDIKIEFSSTHKQEGKPLRVVYYSDIGIPCGGTHVSNTKEIVSVTIRKIKQDKETIRVSYA